MSVSTFFSAIGSAIRRYIVTIFIVLVVGGLCVAVILLNMIIQDSSNTAGITATTDSATFDQQTIDALRQLHTSDDPLPDIILPTGRTNPFAE